MLAPAQLSALPSANLSAPQLNKIKLVAYDSGRLGCSAVGPEDDPERASSSGIGLDFSHWPLIVTTPPSRAVTNEELHAFLDRFEDGLRTREGRYISVIDLRMHTGITPRQRRILTERMNAAHAGVAKGRLSGTAMIFTSALLRSLLTAIFWLRKSDHPTVVLRNLEDALAWGRRTLANVEAEHDVGTDAHSS